MKAPTSIDMRYPLVSACMNHTGVLASESSVLDITLVVYSWACKQNGCVRVVLERTLLNYNYFAVRIYVPIPKLVHSPSEPLKG